MEYDVNELLYMALSDDERAIEMMNSHFQRMFIHLYQEMSTMCSSYNLSDALADCRSAMISAIRYYRPDQQLLFPNFVYLCCRRSMLNAVRALKKSCYAGGNLIYSLDYQLKEEEGSYLGDLSMEANGPDFSRRVIDALSVRKILEENCDQLERRVMEMKMEGYSYQEIAAELKITYKKVDNIIQKVRKKIASSFD